MYETLIEKAAEARKNSFCKYSGFDTVRSTLQRKRSKYSQNISSHKECGVNGGSQKSSGLDEILG